MQYNVVQHRLLFFFKIVLAALEPEACQLFSEENTTFSQVVVALHIAYHLHEDEICRFKELIKVMPSKLRSIKGYDDDEEHSDERTVVWKLNTDAWRLVSEYCSDSTLHGYK